MPNCDAGMTSEVHKCFHEQRRNWSVLPIRRLLIAAVAVCLAVCPATSPILRAAPQQAPSGSNSAPVSDAPVITANPERVKLSDGNGTTEINWDTGNGSQGFVFVTEEGGKPLLFANGSRGREIAPWIKRHSYIFELYGDAERRTLLGTVTVSGVAEPGTRPRTELLHGQLRWLLVAVLFAVLYVAVYLSSTGPQRTKVPPEPTTSPYPLHVARNLLLGLAAFICVDGAVFHTRVYTSILAPDSYAGRIAVITRAEKNRASSGLKEALVLGDSRMAEGFSAAVPNERSSAAGLKFVNLAEPACAVSTWDYMLREVDPTKRRYWAIVVPYGIGFEPNTADPLRISMAAPLLRYGDCFNFASAFRRWSGRFRAFTACILRGSAYQSDVIDFLEHPVARIRSVQLGPKTLSVVAMCVNNPDCSAPRIDG